MEILFIYILGCFLFTLGVAVYAQIKYKQQDSKSLISDRSDVFMAVLLGFSVSCLWPLFILVGVIVWAANHIVKKILIKKA